mmetsp:Transcript_14518/g.21641  ORF Transcript_14518/g.21641 Transcript_14518/m.21641 type:complete len:235 (-) Transcript_14518:392-1096(-)
MALLTEFETDPAAEVTAPPNTFLTVAPTSLSCNPSPKPAAPIVAPSTRGGSATSTTKLSEKARYTSNAAPVMAPNPAAPTADTKASFDSSFIFIFLAADSCFFRSASCFVLSTSNCCCSRRFSSSNCCCSRRFSSSSSFFLFSRVSVTSFASISPLANFRIASATSPSLATIASASINLLSSVFLTISSASLAALIAASASAAIASTLSRAFLVGFSFTSSSFSPSPSPAWASK